MDATSIRILLVIPAAKVDTPQVVSFIKRLARALEAQGAQVDVMKSTKNANPLVFIRLGLELRRLARAHRPDVVVAQYGTFTGLLVALFAPRPKIITYRGSDLNPTPSENPLYVLLKHIASHAASLLADGIVCVSREVAGRLICKKPVEIIPSSTDIELFRPMDKDECRKKIGWELNIPTAIFFAGNDPGKKRLDLALQVREMLERTAREISFKLIQNEVLLEQVPAYLNAADCLVYLSDFEGSPNLIREACACATPIVTVPVGDVKDVLADVTPSRIVERNVIEIAEAVSEVTGLQTRSNGRDKVLCYSNEITARRTLDFYGKIISAFKEATT